MKKMKWIALGSLAFACGEAPTQEPEQEWFWLDLETGGRQPAAAEIAEVMQEHASAARGVS
jgi:hypothetical protein